jgi:hypothetical protein
MTHEEETKDTSRPTTDFVQTGSDPRLADEPRLAEIRRRIEEVASDAPQVAKIALEAMIRRHNPELQGSAQTAGRVGRQSGNVSELTAMARLKPGGAERLRRIFNLTKGNFDGAQRVSTLHDMRFVFFDNDTQILFATTYDGDWDTYINDFATKIPELMDLLFQSVEGWPGIADPSVKDFIAEHQIDAAGWFVANPQVTVVDVRRFQRMEQAVNAMMDHVAGTDLNQSAPKAMKTFLDEMAEPEGMDY